MKNFIWNNLNAKNISVKYRALIVKNLSDIFFSKFSFYIKKNILKKMWLTFVWRLGLHNIKKKLGDMYAWE